MRLDFLVCGLYLSDYFHIVYCKLYEVEKFCGFRNELCFAGKHSQLHGSVVSLVWLNPITQGHHRYFTGKLFWLPINP